MLTDLQVERYSRHIILPQVGGKGQERLLRARVLVNGSGPWQGAALLYLAAAGVGTISVSAEVPPPPLSAFAASRADPVVSALTRLNPDCAVVVYDAAQSPPAERLVLQHDLVLSAPDPLHDVCFALRRPFLCADVSPTDAWLFSCRGYEEGMPCLHCLPTSVPVAPFDTFYGDTAAVFIGAQQATEAIQHILGLRDGAGGTLLHCRFPDLQFRQRAVGKDPRCAFCGPDRT